MSVIQKRDALPSLTARRGRQILARGGGKGAGSSGAPEESADNLFSIQYARVLFAVSEGEIEGLVNGEQSVYFNKTALKNADGSYNFKRVTVSYRNGLLGQSYLTGFPGIEAEIGGGTLPLKITNASPVIQTVTNVNADTARVTVSFPQMSTVDSSGDVRGTKVIYAIDVRANGGAWVQQGPDLSVNGKTNSKYQKSHLVTLAGSPPWDIRVRRITADNVSSRIQSDIYFESLTEIVEAKLRYPMTAVYGIEIDARQFSSIPAVAFDLKLLKIQVPSNYDPLTRIYTGTWDGTFILRWSDNPAWVFYDLVTRSRYGLGANIPATAVDKWSLYTIGKYCDELVPDGFGGMEPRFTCNLYLQAQEQAFKVLSDLASIFRAMVYWGGGQVVAAQDSPSDPVAIFTSANVKDGKFYRQGTSIGKRFTVAHVTYNDPADFYTQKTEYVEDPDGIARYGIREADLVAFGCTSRGQAHRAGRWLLYSSRLEGGLITWRVGLEGLLARPGQIAEIADNNRAGKRIGGRIIAATSSSVTLDKSFTVAAAVTYTLTVVGLDGVAQKRTVSNSPGAATVLTVSSAFTTTPQADSVWIISEPALVPETVKILAAAQVGPNEYEITASAHNPSKFPAIEQNLKLETRPSSLIQSIPDAPQNPAISEFLYESAGGVLSGAILSWDSVAGAAFYSVAYTLASESEITLPLQAGVSVDLRDLYPGILSFTVSAVNLLGRASPSSTASKELFGKTAPPADPTEFGLSAVDETTAILSFNESPDLDVRVGGYWVIRHSPDVGGGVTWTDGIELTRIQGGARQATAPLLAGSYMVKAMDSSGIFSNGFLKVETDAPSVLSYAPLSNIVEQPTFAGVKVDTVASDSLLFLTHDGTIDAIADFDLISSLDNLGNIHTFGTYDFANIINAGANFSAVRLTGLIRASIANLSTTIDTRPGTVDEWESVDGVNPNLSTARLMISTTPDNPAGSPTWSAYAPFVSGHYSGWGFRFRVELSTEDSDQNVYVSAAEVVAEVPPRVEAQYNVTSGASPLGVTFAKAFTARPALAITAENMQTGDYKVVTSQTATGFTIEFKNAAGTSVSRVFDWIAKGFGEI